MADRLKSEEHNRQKIMPEDMGKVVFFWELLSE